GPTMGPIGEAARWAREHGAQERRPVRSVGSATCRGVALLRKSPWAAEGSPVTRARTRQTGPSWLPQASWRHGPVPSPRYTWSPERLAYQDTHATDDPRQGVVRAMDANNLPGTGNILPADPPAPAHGMMRRTVVKLTMIYDHILTNVVIY